MVEHGGVIILACDGVNWSPVDLLKFCTEVILECCGIVTELSCLGREMHQFSDSDTPDSDDGRRFKTESTRPKKDHSERVYRRYKSPSPRRRKTYEERRRRSRTRSPERSSRSRRSNEDRSRRKEEPQNNSRYKEDREDRRSRLETSSRKEKSSNRDKKNDEKDSGKKPGRNSDEIINKKEEKSDVRFGSVLPTSIKKEDDNAASYGPLLPPSLGNSNKTELTNQESNESYEPPLPTSLSKTQASLGADLPPPNLNRKKGDNEEGCEERIIGPDLPAHLREELAKASEAAVSESEDDDMIGPLPPEVGQSKAHIALEERALQIKINNLSGTEVELKKREEWMMELPAVRSVGLGLGPRQFRANAGPDMADRTSWTDTPEDKLRKQAGGSTQEVDLKKEAEVREIKKRDEEQEKIGKKHKKESRKGEKSLLEIHQSEMQKKKKADTGMERRPFSREIDLKVNHFDETQKKAILKKAQLLDDRFSSGQAKYL